jgi:predicted NBD/HSP70 family sugar kinase
LESVTLVATDTNGGVVARERLPGVGTADPLDVIRDLSGSMRAFMTAANIPLASIQGVAVVLPGPMRSDSGTVTEAPALPHWRDVSLQGEFETAFGMPVLVDNDASAAALGEFWSRGVSRYSAFACVYIGSGIGAGVVVDGALFRGSSSNAAEVGHITIDRDGPVCFCGNYGCLEVIAAPRIVVATALNDASITDSLSLDARATVAQNWELLSRAAVEGHPKAKTLVTDSAHAVAGAVLTLTNLFDLDEIVLSGPGLATAGSIFVREVRIALERAFARRAHSTAVDLSINPTDSAAIGAAALTLQGQLAPGHGPALRFAGP